MAQAAITAVGHYLPETRLTNADLEKMVDTTDEWITQRTGIFHPGLVVCVELMEANIEQPLNTHEIAEMVGISKRQLERLFRAHLHTTPTHYYQRIRLQAGLKLLEQTSLTVLEIAVACGFTSAGHFSKRFRAQFGRSPRDVRNPGQPTS